MDICVGGYFMVDMWLYGYIDQWIYGYVEGYMTVWIN